MTLPHLGDHGSVRTLTSYKNGDQHQYHLEFLTGTCNAFFNLPVTGNTFVACPTNVTPTFSMTRSDGYTMVGGIVQGARTYDPTSGQWLTPDAYAGNVSDPMSQKPFMWNNNNPIDLERSKRL